MPPEIVPSLKKYLLTSKADALSENAIGQCIVRQRIVQEERIVAKQIQVLLEDASIRDILESLLVLACDKRHPCRESLTEIGNALRLISAFTERIPTSSKLLEAILQSISSNVVSDMLRQYASQGLVRLGFIHSHSPIGVCPLSYGEAQARLHQSLTIMVLKSALYASHASQNGGHLDASIMSLLLEKHSFDSLTQPTSVECTHRRRMDLTTPKISLFEAVSTPHVDSVSFNWRDGLIRELLRDIDCRYEGVVRMVGEICRDLELRCNEAERPLREEQSKSCDLQARLESSERKKAEFESQALNHQSALKALATERDCLANQVEATERRSKELGTSLETIHREFAHAKIEAKRAAQAVIESAKQQDLAYLATMTGKDEMFDQQSLKLVSTETRVKTLEYELDRMRGLEADNAEKLNISETRIGTLRDVISASECRVKDLQNELIQRKEQNVLDAAKNSKNEALIKELNSKIAAANEACDQNESLISSLNNQLQRADVEASELRLQHDTYVSDTEAKLERLDESNRSSLDKWQSELETAHRSAAEASEQNAATIAGLHNEVRKLRKEREVRVFGIHTALF